MLERCFDTPFGGPLSEALLVLTGIRECGERVWEVGEVGSLVGEVAELDRSEGVGMPESWLCDL